MAKKMPVKAPAKRRAKKRPKGVAPSLVNSSERQGGSFERVGPWHVSYRGDRWTIEPVLDLDRDDFDDTSVRGTDEEIIELMSYFQEQLKDAPFAMPGYKEGYEQGLRDGAPPVPQRTTAKDDPFRKERELGIQIGRRMGFEEAVQAMAGNAISRYASLLKDEAMRDRLLAQFHGEEVDEEDR